MKLQSWKALVQERNSFMHVMFVDDDGFDGLEPLRRYRSEPAILIGERFVQAHSNMRTMVDQFALAANHGTCARVWDSALLDTMSNVTPEVQSEAARTGESDMEARSTAALRKCHKARPCKGQRRRRQKFEEKLVRMVEAFPEVFNFGSIHFPPSLENDEKGKRDLAMRLEAHKQWVIGERETKTNANPADFMISTEG